LYFNHSEIDVLLMIMLLLKKFTDLVVI